jgi:hypothetical protein
MLQLHAMQLRRDQRHRPPRREKPQQDRHGQQHDAEAKQDFPQIRQGASRRKAATLE